MSMPPTKRTEASLLTERLRLEIVNGSLSPGERLKLVPLARRFEVSRGPLREAATRLAAEGLVVIEDQRGFTVAPVSRADLIDVTTTRKRIEGLALRDAIQHGDVAWEGRVMAAAHMLSRVTGPGTDRHTFRAAHARFHAELVSACPGRHLLAFRQRLYVLTERYRNLLLTDAVPLQPARDIDAEHQGIASAAVERNADRAVALLEAHLGATADLLMKTHPDLFGAP